MEAKAVNDAISFMWLNYDQKITLDRLAAHAVYSKFYFLRRFRALTGVTPGRFLTAIRLKRSKEFLAFGEGMSVTDVSIAVGYDSMGAFSTKFRQMVGVTPKEYQAFHRGDLLAHLPMCSQPDQAEGMRGAGATIRISGRLDTLHAPVGTPSAVTHVALFAADSPQVRPVSCALVEPEQSHFTIPGVPPGAWNVQALTFGHEAASATRPSSVASVAVGRVNLSAADLVSAGGAVHVNVTMREVANHAVPVVTALPEFHVHVNAMRSGRSRRLGSTVADQPAGFGDMDCRFHRNRTFATGGTALIGHGSTP